MLESMEIHVGTKSQKITKIYAAGGQIRHFPCGNAFLLMLFGISRLLSDCFRNGHRGPNPDYGFASYRTTHSPKKNIDDAVQGNNENLQ